MRKSNAVALAAVALVSIAVRLSPLWSFLYWGSDTGEYFSILRALIRSDHLTTTYYGWGVTYPYFPGMFFAQAGFVDLGGLDVPTTINLLVPVPAPSGSSRCSWSLIGRPPTTVSPCLRPHSSPAQFRSPTRRRTLRPPPSGSSWPSPVSCASCGFERTVVRSCRSSS